MKKIIYFIFLFFVCSQIFSCRQQSDSEKRKARPAPDWITNGIIYQIQPRAFTQEGTLIAATEKLAHVADLGATIVYLCPVFVADDDTDTLTWSPRQKASKMNNPRNPYRMMDYYHVDAEYGTDDDLKEFVKESHRLGLRVMLDMVYYHCGANAVFLKDNPDFIVRDDDGKSITGGWNWPELNFKNPDLREYLYNNMEYWVKDFGVDGFRCDVAGRVPLDFWETARERLEKLKPDIGILAESDETSRPEDQIKAFDINYSFQCYRTLDAVYKGEVSAKALRDKWNEIEEIVPTGARFIHYFDNHDISNDDYHNRRETRWGFAGCQAALAHIFTLDGVPFIYNGQEIADTARHSIFGRAPIHWASAETLAGKTRFDFVQKLCELYKKEKALTQGSMTWLENDQPEAVLAYLRKFDEEEILTVINLADQTMRTRIQGLQNLTSSSFQSVLSENITGNPQDGFEIQDYGFWIGKRKLND
jgi:cyclomaltodextrinase / maltogenic alpha-amylase / neopullulanase